MAKGVSFRERVIAVVREIPKGKTLSYAEVARRAGHTRAARAVGAIMAGNRDASVPCHRVIRADGTLGGYNAINGRSKAALLSCEAFIANQSHRARALQGTRSPT